MAVNDSIYMINQLEARPLMLYQLDDKYIFDGTYIKLRSNGTNIAQLTPQWREPYGYSIDVSNTQLWNNLLTEILSGDTYTTPPYQGKDYERLPEPANYYKQQYNTYFKMNGKVNSLTPPFNKVSESDIDVYLGCIANIGDGTEPFKWWHVTPWWHFTITDINGDINYSGRYDGTLWPCTNDNNKQSTHTGAVGLITDINTGVPSLIFHNITDRGLSSTHITNNTLMSEGIKADTQSASTLKFTELKFNLCDSTNFEYGDEAKPHNYGGGTFDISSDTIGVPNDPDFDFTTQGCGTLYKISSLKNIFQEIFPDFDGLEDMGKIFEVQQHQALKGYIIDAYALPIEPIVGSDINIEIGWKTLNQTAKPLTKQWKTVTCGTYSLKEYFGNFLDYEGTEIKLFLPFIGFVDINPEFIVSGSMEVIYKFDCVSGEFTCFIISHSGKSNLSSVISQYSGSAITHIPLNTIDHTSQVQKTMGGISKMVGGAGSIIGGIATGGMAGLGSGVSGVMDIASGVNSIATAKPTASLSNSYSGSSALMGIRTPFYLISRPVAQFSSKYRSELGLPLNVAKKLSDVKGFTICQVPDYNNPNATMEECEQIKNLLNSGIIL